MNQQPECAFCRIVEGSEPSREILRTRDAMAFFPLEPATLGHTLVIPTQHIPDIWHLDQANAEPLTIATLRIAGAIRRAMNPDGLNLIQSNGEAATQTVPHVHIHLVPRFHGDAMGRIWPPETDFSESAKDYAWAKIREEVAHEF